ncbi:hypothetical protein ACFXJ8_41420 [Nonomuraea sp. NPDC059194]|uniref:hypothetical protein n=1 Tax=Nonomuraea sp. NPDC059194 TaxID=3346764 RepID=UPI0036B60F91
MSDPYRIDPNPRPPHSPQPQHGRSALRAMLWILMAVGVAVNLVSNIAAGGDLTPIGLAGGVVGVGSIAGLIAVYITGRRS